MKSVKINPELMDPEKYDENHIKECAECLLEADEIKKDEVLMKKIKEFWDKQSSKIDSIKKLKEVASNFVEKKGKEAE